MSDSRLSDQAMRRVNAHVGAIAAGLRELADEIERTGRQHHDHPTTLAADVQKKLAWGFANLNAEGLTYAVADYVKWLSAEKEQG